MRPRLLAACAALSWGAALAAQQSGLTRPAGVAPQLAATTSAQPPVDYQQDIKPLLEAKCGECHNGIKRKGGLALQTYADILDGGKDGPIVQPGHSADSMLLKRLTGDEEEQMPKDDPPLPPGEIALIARWIDEGVRETAAGPPAPAPWIAPLTLDRPALPGVVWPDWKAPADRLVADYLRRQGQAAPALIDDARFARRVHLDLWGLLPTPEQLQAFLGDTHTDKRARLVRTLLDDDDRYAGHWISFWNDLLRNEDGVTYFSESAGRQSITPWLLPALRENLAYDRFVAALIDPAKKDDPKGFVTGVNWRGETSAAVTPWMQAAQNTSQVFLGVNLKCASCHDSFVNKWKLKDAYGLAAYFSPDGTLQMYRCDLPQDRRTGPGFIFPGFARSPRSGSLADRRAAAAATFTDPRLGRLPRTLVNRVWQRLLGRGIVANVDEMDGEPWSPALLDWLAADFAGHDYDIKHLIETIVTSRAYQMAAVRREGEAPARGYVFRGPEVRRLSAEQFADAIGSITGEWSVAPLPGPRAPSGPKPDPDTPLPSQPTSAGVEAREWRAPSSTLTRGLGRPIRDQITSVRASDATTLQALELTNGAVLSRWLARGARRMLGQLPPDPPSRYTRTVAGRNAAPSRFDIDVSGVKRLWLVVEDTGSNVPEALLPAWADAELVGPAGATPLSALTPAEGTLRAGDGPLRVPRSRGDGIRVGNPSVVVYDVAGRGFTHFRGAIGIENARSDIGSTLNPALRFYVFDVAPNPDRLVPATPGAPLPRPAPLTTVDAAVDRVFRHALGRPPRPAERSLAESALRAESSGNRPSPDGLADLLWAVLMTPEFQILD